MACSKCNKKGKVEYKEAIREGRLEVTTHVPGGGTITIRRSTTGNTIVKKDQGLTIKDAVRISE